ncbi:MAG: hypothetical protein EXS10_10570 [Phycisphaerales bacterium]|nr:hypothetical protein [Phycisphaerales bacterium]
MTADQELVDDTNEMHFTAIVAEATRDNLHHDTANGRAIDVDHVVETEERTSIDDEDPRYRSIPCSGLHT